MAGMAYTLVSTEMYKVMKKKIIKVDKKAFKKMPKLGVTLPKCKHKWEIHNCNCGLCDVYGFKICYECGSIK